MKMLVSMLSVCCLLAGSPAIAAPAPVVLFDEGHGQPFLAGGQGPLDLSSLAERFVAAGCEVHTTAQPLTAEVLSEADVLVVSGAFQPLTTGEVAAVREFVFRGGGLAVMLHVAPPLSGLLEMLQVDYANGIVHDADRAIDNDPRNFLVTTLAEHPLTAGLESFAVYGSWALRSLDPSVVVVARTGRHGWVDLNSDGRLTSGDAMGAFGVMVAGAYGQGRFTVCGDDALFQNRYFAGGNRSLADRLARWLCTKASAAVEQ